MPVMATLILTATELANSECDAYKTLRAIAEAAFDWWHDCHSVELEFTQATFHGFATTEDGRLMVVDGTAGQRVPVTVQV